MKSSLLASLALIAVLAALALSGCGQAAPATAPTVSPAAAKSADAPTAAPAAQPTAAPAAKKVDFPVKDKTVTMIVSTSAGGSTDLQARLNAAGMEKALGVPVQVVNKGAAAHQEGVTALVQAKPDGYTLVTSNLPSVPLTYLNPDRKAVYGRKDLVQVAMVASDPEAIAVGKSSPYKTLQELIAAAKAKPGELKIATSGLGNDTHLALMLFEQVTGTKFSAVHFNGSAPAVTALLGGHVDLAVQTVGSMGPSIKSGEARLLGVMDSDKSSFAPDAPTMASLGVDVKLASDRGYSVPAGTPKDVVAVLEQAIKKSYDDPAFVKGMGDSMIGVRWMGSDQFSSYWDQYEAKIKPLVGLIPKQ